MKSAKRQSLRRVLFENGLAALLYWLAGLLGLKLALGALEASLVWPGAGIALAALYLRGGRVGPGLFAGMLAVSLYQAGASDPHTLLISAILSANALLQGWIGVLLIRRKLGADAPLIGGREVAWFFLLGGAVSCLVAPSLGIAVLVGAGIIGTETAPITWMTWWVGDASGVAIFSPIMLALFSGDRRVWRQRRKTVALPTVILLSLVSLFHWYANQQELRRLELLFQRQAQLVNGKIVRGLTLAEEIPLSLKSLFDSSQEVDAESFGVFVRPLLNRHEFVQALEWIPRVSHQQRLRARAGELADIPAIREPDDERKMVTAAPREYYFPITYLEPVQGNERAQGFDVSTNSAVSKALALSEQTGMIVSSGPIQLIQDHQERPGFVLYAPVFEPPAVGTDRGALLGFVAAVFRVEGLIDSVLPQVERPDMDLVVSDGGMIVYGEPTPDARPTAGADRAELAVELAIANRQWSLRYRPNRLFFESHFRWDGWWMHAFGFAFAGLMASLFLVVSGRSLVTEGIVDRRTAELRHEVNRRAAVIRHLDAHNEVLRQMTETDMPLRDLLMQIVDRAEWADPDMICTISLVEDEGRQLRLAANRSLPPELARLVESTPLENGYGSCAMAARERRRVQVDAMAHAPVWAQFREAVQKSGIQVSWSEPILSAGNEMLGTFGVYFYQPPTDREAAEGLLLDFGKLVALAIERRQAQSHISRLAYFDSLTGLPNRERILQYLAEEIAACNSQRCFSAVMFIDVDDLKDVNDSLGHHEGDELIRELSRRLLSVCREGDMAARLGGDEFVLVIACRVPVPERIEALIVEVFDRIQEALSWPFRLHGYEHIVTVSVGASLIPQPGVEATEILQQADTAMYRAKREGKNSLSLYHSDMKVSAQHFFNVEKGLVDALAHDRLELHYQLQFDEQRRPVAAEALLRWRHPEKGILPAGDFIVIAEKSSLIVRLGAWVIERACRQISDLPWLDYVAVNVSPRHLKHPEFVSSVLSAIDRNGINPQQLALEITEHSLIENVQDHLEKLKELKDAGLRISIDDFGTGYSSLFYLKNLPLSQIKIDKAFISGILDNPNDAFIVSSVIRLARKMNLELVAEGVETEPQFQFLIDNHCVRFQGYLLAMPEPIEQLNSRQESRFHETGG